MVILYTFFLLSNAEMTYILPISLFLMECYYAADSHILRAFAHSLGYISLCQQSGFVREVLSIGKMLP